MKEDVARVAEMSDVELYQALKDNNISAGPILPSTRRVYEAKLIEALLDSSRSSQEDTDVSFSPRKSPAFRASLAASAKRSRHNYVLCDSDTSLNDSVSPVKTRAMRRSLGRSAQKLRLPDEGVPEVEPAPFVRYLTGASTRRVMLETAPQAKSNSHEAHRMQVIKSVIIVGVGVVLSLMLAFAWRSADPYEVLEEEVKQLVDRMGPGSDGYE